MELHEGDIAPDFTLATENENETVTLSKLRGKKVVLYFYPKDNTPGCTKEACDFRDNFARLQQYNVEVFGISKDSAKSHAKFKEKHSLPFTLLVDPDAHVMSLYGAYGKKTLFGNFYTGITRSTVLIDEEGKISKIWKKVSVKGHVEQIIDAVK